MSTKCCFCCKELPSRSEWNNPEPLNNDRGTVCCPECNTDYVCPARRILWRPWVTNTEYSQILVRLQSMPLHQLKDVLPKQQTMMTPPEYKEFLDKIRG